MTARLRRLRSVLLDYPRLRRALLIGGVLGVPLNFLVSPREAIALDMLICLLADSWLVCRAAWSMDEPETRALFSALREGIDCLVERTVGLNFIGFGVISLCVSDLGPVPSVLPKDFRVMVFFLSVLLIWMALHHGFAVHYASLHYQRTALSKQFQPEPIFEFPGKDEPQFFDFVYVSYTVGMTFEMSDVGARTTEVRKIVVVQALLAFLYTTIAISACVTLCTL